MANLAVPSFLFSLLACSEASAGYVGDRFLPSTLATVVPTPADFLNFPQVVVLPEIARGREVDLPVGYSKLITPDWSVIFTETFRNIDEVNRRSGFDNLVIGTQYELYSNAEHQFVFSVGGTAALGGTGSSDIAASFSTLTPIVYAGKGFGDLPDSLAWLRPVNLTANVGVALPTESTTTTGATVVTNPNIFEWSFALEYSLLTNHQSGGHRFAEGWVPLVEFALSTPLDGPLAGETTGTVNPGVIWVGKSFQVGLEAIVPINERSGSDFGVRGQVHFYLGNIVPNTIGKPIFN